MREIEKIKHQCDCGKVWVLQEGNIFHAMMHKGVCGESDSAYESFDLAKSRVDWLAKTKCDNRPTFRMPSEYVGHIRFKAKPTKFADEVMLKIPKITRNHCNMAALHTHSKFGPYSNSQLLLPRIEKTLALLRGELVFTCGAIPGATIHSGAVMLEATGFFWEVSIDLDRLSEVKL